MCTSECEFLTCKNVVLYTAPVLLFGLKLSPVRRVSGKLLVITSLPSALHRQQILPPPYIVARAVSTCTLIYVCM